MANETNSKPEQTTPNGKKKSKLRLIAPVILVLIVAGALYWWFFSRNRVSTDDAYVVADSVMVSSRVTGTITKYKVDNDVYVKKGEVLVELDPKDYQALVDKGKAAVESVQAQIGVEEVTISLIEDQTAAQVQVAQAAYLAAQGKKKEAQHKVEETEQTVNGSEAEFGHAKKDFERYSNIYKQGAGSEQMRDRASTAYKKAKSQLDAANAQVGSVKAALSVSDQEIDRAKAQLEAAKSERLKVDVEKRKLASLKANLEEQKAGLNIAELNLSYCTVKAPISGYVAQSKIEEGERIQAGQPLFAIVPLQEAYAEANFKETQLENVRIGQPADIKADIYPGFTYHGKVVGIRAGTGAAFSLLPPENATGNWIKVVQRIPVKIVFDSPPPADHPLRVGASLDITVFTADRSGPRLHVKGSKRSEGK